MVTRAAQTERRTGMTATGTQTGASALPGSIVDAPAIPATGPRILLIEDDPDTAQLYREVLSDHFHGDRMVHARSLAQAVLVDLRDIDLVLTDYNLPDGNGLEALDLLLRRRPELPIIMVTAETSLETAARAIRKGAHDYLVKAGDYLLALPLVIEKNLEIHRTRRENAQLSQELTQTLLELRIKNEQLEEMVRRLETVAATDALTGLANRRAVQRTMDRAIAEASRHGHDLACIMIDLDRFKQLNDTAGHPAGDEMLKTAGRVLESNCRRSDVAGRLGGDEFILVLPQASIDTAQRVAQRVFDTFENQVKELIERYPNWPKVSMSMGVASLKHSRPSDAFTLIAHADHALYRAKQLGKCRVAVYNASTLNQDAEGPTAPAHDVP